MYFSHLHNGVNSNCCFSVWFEAAPQSNGQGPAGPLLTPPGMGSQPSQAAIPTSGPPQLFIPQTLIQVASVETVTVTQDFFSGRHDDDGGGDDDDEDDDDDYGDEYA